MEYNNNQDNQYQHLEILATGPKIIGRTVREIEQEYDLTVDHLHRGRPEVEKRLSPKPNMIVQPLMSIHVKGSQSSLDRLAKEN
jgi:uncharacterized transporter YbjL